MKKKILVAMSGGVDSSAVCLMLQEQGYEVAGFTMRVFDLPRQFAEGSDEPDFVRSARALARRLGIEHHVADVREAFRDEVVRYFLDEYEQGRTPNPCVRCNRRFKFRLLEEWADRLGCPEMATGHYGRRRRDDAGNACLLTGLDPCKDQSYFLWQVPQSTLRRCRFPLGELTKQQVRDYLAARGFTLEARQGESMEVCFVEGDYRDFLRAQRRAVAGGAVLLGRGAEADVRRRNDEDRLVLHVRRTAVDAVNRLDVVSVDLQHLPAVALEAPLGVVPHGERRIALDRDVVRVVDENEVGQLHRAGPRADLVRDALLEVAVAAKDPGLVRDRRFLGGQREADAHGNALAERSRRHLDAGHEPALGVARTAAAPLTEGLELVHRELAHAGEVKERVHEGGGVPAREDKAVAARPQGILRIDVEMLEPENARQVGHAQGRAGMSGVRLLDDVRAEAADGRRHEFQFVSCQFHISIVSL